MEIINIIISPVIGGLFQCYDIKRKIGERYYHFQTGISICLQCVFKKVEVIEYLKSNEESLKKVINKLLKLISSQNEYIPAHILQIWYVLFDQYDESCTLSEKYIPQLISSAIQALSSGASSDSKKQFASENTISWKNRAEAGRLLTLIPLKISKLVIQPYADEVISYLDQSRHDRVCFFIYYFKKSIL